MAITIFDQRYVLKLENKEEYAFKTFCVELACSSCKENGKATECKHMLHLVPSWQSSERHVRLKKVMEDRPDLIASELSGLAFDSLQQCFRYADDACMSYAEATRADTYT